MIHESDLKLLLLEYDKTHGAFPDHAWEGLSFWNWLMCRMNKRDQEVPDEEWERKLERMKRP